MDVDDILYNQIESEAQKKFKLEIDEIHNQYSIKVESLEQEKIKFTEEKADFHKIIKQKIEEEVEKEKAKIADSNLEFEQKIKKQVEDKTSARIKEYEKLLEEQSKEITNLNQAKAEVIRLEREKEELRAKIEVEQEEKLTKILKNKTLEIQKSEKEKNEFKISEKDKIINDLNYQLEEAQLKLKQGSVQLQGEVQELAIENWLSERFIYDKVEEIKKGISGADCLQIVNTRERLNCGTIYYESKRTKKFSSEWIAKFKEDMRVAGADVGVIVTQVMPNDMNRMGIKDGIWICSFEEFKNLSYVLREYIIKINSLMISQDNKGSKMEQLYCYLTSDNFKLQIDSIIHSFEDMQSDLTRERKYLEGIWKKREKQIDKVLKSSVEMYASVKDIAGSVIQDIQSLELPMDEEDM